MKVRQEIERFSRSEDKPILLALFEVYHYQSQWNFVACCEFEPCKKSKWGTRRVWVPTREGRVLYGHMLKEKGNL